MNVERHPSFLWIAMLILATKPVVCADDIPAQGNEKSQLTEEDASSIISELESQLSESITDDVPIHVDSSRGDEGTLAHYASHEKWRAKFIIRLYEWQLLSSQIIFYLVIFIVMSGLYFSWVQFRQSIPSKDGPSLLGLLLSRFLPRRTPTPPTAAGKPSNESAPNAHDDRGSETRETPGTSIHTIEASSAGFKISTPVVGVVILGISLLFFYVYIQFVYPITRAPMSE